MPKFDFSLFFEAVLLKIFIRMFPLLKGTGTVISEGNILPGTLYMQLGERQIYNPTSSVTSSSVPERLHFTLTARGYS